MKKNHQNGFILAEAFIVSTLVLTILVFMFLQIKTIINGYNKSFTYDTIQGIYHSREIRKYIQTKDYVSLLEEVDEHEYVILDSTNLDYEDIFSASNVKTIIISDGNLNSISSTNSISQKLKNYIKTLTNSSEYRLIVEFNDDTFATIRW